MGQLGNGTTIDSSTPVFVTGINNAVSLSFNGLSACAVLADGTAKCWGQNTVGDFLENGGVAFSSSPVTIASQSNLVGSIALGATEDASFTYDIQTTYGPVPIPFYTRYAGDPACAATASGSFSTPSSTNLRVSERSVSRPAIPGADSLNGASLASKPWG